MNPNISIISRMPPPLSAGLPGIPPMLFAAGVATIVSTEQARGEAIDARTDIYSFGVVLYQMATGRPAFRGKTSGELIGSILHETPVKPSILNAGCDIASTLLEAAIGLREVEGRLLNLLGAVEL